MHSSSLQVNNDTQQDLLKRSIASKTRVKTKIELKLDEIEQNLKMSKER